DTLRDPDNKPGQLPTIKTQYDQNGRITSTTDANGKAIVQTYDTTNFTETVRDKNLNSTQITYNERGNVVREEKALNDTDVAVTTYVYGDTRNPDKATKISQMVSGQEMDTLYAYDDR